MQELEESLEKGRDVSEAVKATKTYQLTDGATAGFSFIAGMSPKIVLSLLAYLNEVVSVDRTALVHYGNTFFRSGSWDDSLDKLAAMVDAPWAPTVVAKAKEVWELERVFSSCSMEAKGGSGFRGYILKRKAGQES